MRAFFAKVALSFEPSVVLLITFKRAVCLFEAFSALLQMFGIVMPSCQPDDGILVELGGPDT